MTVLSWAKQHWERHLAREAHRAGNWQGYVDRLNAVGDDQDLRARLAINDLKPVIASGVEEGKSREIGRVLRFVKTRPELQAQIYAALNEALTEAVTPQPKGNQLPQFRKFVQSIHNWPLFAPALDANIVKRGLTRLLGELGGNGVGHFADGVVQQRPELLPQVHSALTEGMHGFFADKILITNYPSLLNDLGSMPYLRGLVEETPDAQRHVGAFADRLPVVFEAIAKQRMLVHQPGDSRPQLAQNVTEAWLTRARFAYGKDADMRPAIIFEAAATLATRRAMDSRLVGAAELKLLLPQFEYHKDALAPELCRRIEAVYKGSAVLA